jgi:uncharacterized coiled-coil DUF342 family protein
MKNQIMTNQKVAELTAEINKTRNDFAETCKELSDTYQIISGNMQKVSEEMAKAKKTFVEISKLTK